MPRSKAIKPYLLETVDRCFSCGGLVPVVTFAAESFIDNEDPPAYPIDDFVILKQVEWLPKNIASLVKERCQGYFLDEDEYGGKHYTNHCACGMMIDEQYMHQESDSAFYPTSDEQLERTQLVALPIEGDLSIVAQWHAEGYDSLTYQVERVSWQEKTALVKLIERVKVKETS